MFSSALAYIEDCIGSVGIYTEQSPGYSKWHTTTAGKIRILELQIPCCYFIYQLCHPLRNAGSTEHGSLHHRIFRCFVIEKKLANVQGAMYSLVAPRKLLTLTSGYGASCIFYTDGSLIEGCAGFVVHQMGVGGFGHKILSPAGVFTAELSVLFTTLRHIAEVIRPPERCLILTNSLSSIKAMLSRKIAHQTRPLVFLNNCGGVFALMWIPSHVGNELVDERARQAALEGSIFDRPLSPSDFQSLARPAFMRAWQTKWDSADTGRFAHSIFPDVVQSWHFGPGLRARRRGEALCALCQGFYLDIALFDRISVDFE
jgi:hypothetical protein